MVHYSGLSAADASSMAAKPQEARLCLLILLADSADSCSVVYFQGAGCIKKTAGFTSCNCSAADSCPGGSAATPAFARRHDRSCGGPKPVDAG